MIAKNKAYPKQNRLRKALDFKRVFERSNKINTFPYRYYVRENGGLVARLGLVVAKKKLARAVHRNRVKRHVRESFREHQHDLFGFDVIVMASYGIAEVMFESQEKNVCLLTPQWKKVIVHCARLRSAWLEDTNFSLAHG
jgi:ribonuclease P protein component